MALTDYETNVIRELSGDVRELTQVVKMLELSVNTQLTNEANCRVHVQHLSNVVFGVDGDLSKPGLKGEMISVKKDVAEHSETLEAIDQKYKAGVTRIWAAVTAIAAAVVAAVVKHFWP